MESETNLLPKGILIDLNNYIKKKKKVSWDKVLIKVRYFELDETERDPPELVSQVTDILDKEEQKQANVSRVKQRLRKSALPERMSQFSVVNLVSSDESSADEAVEDSTPSKSNATPKKRKSCVGIKNQKPETPGISLPKKAKLSKKESISKKESVKRQSASSKPETKQKNTLTPNCDYDIDVDKEEQKQASVSRVKQRLRKSALPERMSQFYVVNLVSSDESSADEAVEESTPSKSNATPKKRKSCVGIKNQKSETPGISLPKKAKLSKKESISKKESVKRQSASSKPETKQKNTLTPNCDYDIDVDDRSTSIHETFNGNFSYTPKHFEHIPYYTACKSLTYSDESSADEAVEDYTPSKSKATPKKRKSCVGIKNKKSDTPGISLPKKAKLSKKESISKKESMKRQSASSKPETKQKNTSTPNCGYDIDVDDRSTSIYETFNGNFSYTPKHFEHIPYYTSLKSLTYSDESSADEAVEDYTPSKSKATPKKRKSCVGIKNKKSDTPGISLPKKAKLSKKESISKKESMKRQSASSKPETKQKNTSTPNCDYDIDVDDRSTSIYETFNGNFSYTPKHFEHTPYYTAAPLPQMVSRAIPDPAPFDVHYVSDTLKKKTIVPSELTFGFLGTGAIGSGVIKNLVHTKHKVVIWNRSSDKSEPFKKLGVDILQTPSDVVRAADITFCCVADDKAAKALVFGNCGVGSEMKPNKAYVEMSGISPEDSLDIFEDISSRGGKYLELRFVGSRKEAEDGSLALLAAGDRTVFRDCDSCFKAMGIYTKFLGSEIGLAAKFASVCNVMVGVTIGGLSEAMALAERIGIEKQEVAEVIENSELSSEILNAACEAINNNDFSTKMTLGAMQKNIRLALNVGDKFGKTLRITATTNEVLVGTKM